MKYFFSLIFLFATFTTIFSQTASHAVISAERHTFTSQILEEERSFQVYLPPSYFNSEEGNFPVIYLMDGDYNFYYDTGLIEFLSSVADKIPEMIVIGISDKGSTKYRDYCRPNHTSSNGGNANKFMDFLEKELKPMVQKKYRISEQDILIGHSMGGLFVSNYFLERPEDFNHFIAIDPSLWWNDYALAEKADSIFDKRKLLKSNLFISLASTQGMGIRNFVGMLDKHYPYSTKWNFKHYENENHGSLHQIAIQDALLSLFKDWAISRTKFYRFKSAQDLMDHYKQFNKKFSTNFTLPAYNFASMMNYYYRKNLTADIELLEKEIIQHFPNSLDEFYIALAGYQLGAKKYDEAEKTYEKCLSKRPKSFRSLDGLSKIYLARKEHEKAKTTSQRAIEMAKSQQVRQWRLNELQANLEDIIQVLEK
jgi:predicted alpha/beta superfamily hydrolase